jgi:hypothetical protein
MNAFNTRSSDVAARDAYLAAIAAAVRLTLPRAAQVCEAAASGFPLLRTQVWQLLWVTSTGFQHKCRACCCLCQHRLRACHWLWKWPCVLAGAAGLIAHHYAKHVSVLRGVRL